VAALEEVTDFWQYGKGKEILKDQPVYLPVRHTIMPRPKFRDYSKED